MGWNFVVDAILLCQIAHITVQESVNITPRDIWVIKPCSGSIALNSGVYFVHVGWY